ncbi:MAG: hypothetical protein M3Q65_22840 [Chloroflexota bacterium]|nr:hypothetical protein [Chloroflexota bacterium]
MAVPAAVSEQRRPVGLGSEGCAARHECGARLQGRQSGDRYASGVRQVPHPRPAMRREWM